MIFIFGEESRSTYTTAATLNNRHPDTNVNHAYVNQLVAKFEETGSVANRKRNQLRILDEAANIEVLEQYAANPTISTCKAEAEAGLSQRSIVRVLKNQKFKPYQMHVVRELGEDDADERIEFCETITNPINTNPLFVRNTFTSDWKGGAFAFFYCRYGIDFKSKRDIYFLATL
ncbi:hypothetical protein FQR65_LT12520 [Abscondita terminalis]|nr:hypothetical protein FQR65_LT12520 [Abscondita terminalis]